MKVKVVATPEKGFRRIGKKFTREAQEIEVTDKELKVLKAEKNLVVVELPAETEKDNKKK